MMFRILNARTGEVRQHFMASTVNYEAALEQAEAATRRWNNNAPHMGHVVLEPWGDNRQKRRA